MLKIGLHTIIELGFLFIPYLIFSSLKFELQMREEVLQVWLILYHGMDQKTEHKTQICEC